MGVECTNVQLQKAQPGTLLLKRFLFIRQKCRFARMVQMIIMMVLRQSNAILKPKNFVKVGNKSHFIQK